MTTVTFFLLGTLTGATLMWWLQSVAHRQASASDTSESEYLPARRAVIRHLRVHGTLNLAQMEQLLDVSGVFALKQLDRMVHDGLLKQQGHRSKGAFYTLT